MYFNSSLSQHIGDSNRIVLERVEFNRPKYFTTYFTIYYKFEAPLAEGLVGTISNIHQNSFVHHLSANNSYIAFIIL